MQTSGKAKLHICKHELDTYKVVSVSYNNCLKHADNDYILISVMFPSLL